jgi:Putative Na+/H+ antiporter
MTLNPTTVQLVGTALFAIAVAHTFLTRHFERLAHLQPAHAGVWHQLAEVEVVFGFWALVFVLFLSAHSGHGAATTYLVGLNFTEPMFVFVIMVMAASRPILQLARALVTRVSSALPMPPAAAFVFTALALTPLLGSFITEPAAMTLCALLLREQIFAQAISRRLKYAMLGALFVNISIGGTLTPYAAPPVLMVAATWGWDLPFMLSTFGWRAALAVVVNSALVTAFFWAELKALKSLPEQRDRVPVPLALVLVHVAFVAAVVASAHYPEVFMGLFLFFLGICHAYERHQDRLMLREALLVAFFLAGLVTLGGQQGWWLQHLLADLNTNVLFFGAVALTAITDNAALTYLGSLVQGTDAAFKYALVAGAVTGGGLTVIANAPNPAGFAILRSKFDDATISPLGLLAAALPPTAVAVVAFWFL